MTMTTPLHHSSPPFLEISKESRSGLVAVAVAVVVGVDFFLFFLLPLPFFATYPSSSVLMNRTEPNHR